MPTATPEILRRQSDPVHEVGIYQITFALTAGAIAIGGLAGSLVSRRRGSAVLAGLVTVLLVVGIASLSSIGILLLLLTAIPVWYLIRRLADGMDWPALLGGAAVGAGLSLLDWVALQPPLVSCSPGGSVVSIDGRYESVSGASTGNGGNEQGWVQFDGHRLQYECRDGELVRFTRTISSSDGRP